jgi:hypothetical protein
VVPGCFALFSLPSLLTRSTAIAGSWETRQLPESVEAGVLQGFGIGNVDTTCFPYAGELPSDQYSGPEHTFNNLGGCTSLAHRADQLQHRDWHTTEGRESGLNLRGWKQGLNPRPFRHRPTCAMVKHALYQLSYPPR